MEKRRGLTGDTSSKRWFFQCYISFCGCITKNRQRENPPKSQIVQKSVAYVCFVFLKEFTRVSLPPHLSTKDTSPPFFITWFPRPGHIFGGPNGTPGFAIVDMCADLKRNQGWKDGCLVWFFGFDPQEGSVPSVFVMGWVYPTWNKGLICFHF